VLFLLFVKKWLLKSRHFTCT